MNYCDENHHIERIPVAVQNIDHLFHLASKTAEPDRFYLFLISESIRIDEYEYLSSLEDDTELIICKEEQIDLFWIEKILKPQKHLLSVKY